MSPNEWKELERLAKLRVLDPPRGKGAEILNKTRLEKTHPDGYDGPCHCKLCAGNFEEAP